MDLKITHCSRLKRDLWDDLVQGGERPRVYGMSDYVEAVSPRKWAVLTDADFNCGLLLFPRKKWGLTYLTVPPFVQISGLYGNGVSEEILHSMLGYLQQTYAKAALSVSQPSESWPAKWDGEKRVNFYLPLNESYTAISERYKSRLKRVLKKDPGLNFTEEKISEEFHSFAEKHFPAVAVGAVSPKHLHQYLTGCDKAGLSRLYCCRNSGGELIAALFTVFWSDRIYLTCPVSSPVGREVAAMHFLIDHLIREYSSSPRVLDFEGSSIAGVAQFYRQFAPQTEYFYSLEKPLLTTALDKAFSKYVGRG